MGGDLDCERTDTAGRAGYQDTTANERTTQSHTSQRGQSGNRQGRGLCETDVVRQRNDAVHGDGNLFCPSEFVGKRHNSGPVGWTKPVRGGSSDYAANVLTGYPTGFVVDERSQFPTIEGKGLHL